MTDLELLNFSKCNLLDYSESRPEYLAAYYTTKVILLRRAGEYPITKTFITITFEKEYQTFFIGKEKDSVYWAGIKAGRRFISKLFWLLTTYFSHFKVIITRILPENMLLFKNIVSPKSR
jgi:hypothetical protein